MFHTAAWFTVHVTHNTSYSAVLPQRCYEYLYLRRQQSKKALFSGRPSVRCPSTPILRDTIYLHLVEEFQRNLLRIFIIAWLGIAWEGFQSWVQKAKMKVMIGPINLQWLKYGVDDHLFSEVFLTLRVTL